MKRRSLRVDGDVVVGEGEEFVEVGFEGFVEERNEESGLWGDAHCGHIYYTIEEWMGYGKLRRGGVY